MAFRPKYSSVRLLCVQFLYFPSLLPALAKCDPVNCHEGVLSVRSEASFDMETSWSSGNVWLGLSCKINPQSVPGSFRVQIWDFHEKYPRPRTWTWTWTWTWSRHIKMFMRSLAMSSIQPLGHKLPKALNLIHKDIKQLLNNPWYFISIVLTTSIHVSSEAENKNKKARQEISAPRLSLCLWQHSLAHRDLIISVSVLSGSQGPKHHHRSSSQRFLSQELLEEFTSFLCPQSSVLRLWLNGFFVGFKYQEFS